MDALPTPVATGDRVSFVLAFLARGIADLRLHPMPLVTSPAIVIRWARQRVCRVTLQVLKEAGPEGVPSDHLREAFAAVDFPPAEAASLERHLVEDGLVRVQGDRLVFVGQAGDWARLAEASA